jgi:hypothetical protein
MRTKSSEIQEAGRPLEYVAFFTVQLATREGPAFLYLAVDAFTAYAFHLGLERDESPDHILKYIYNLTEDPEFLRHADDGFTLVLEKYEDLSERINSIINPMGGKLLFNKTYNHHIALPVLKSMSEFLRTAES